VSTQKSKLCNRRVMARVLLSITTLSLGGCEVALGPVALLGAGLVAALGGGGDKKQAQIALGATNLAFGDQVIVVSSAPQAITVTNTGNAVLQISQVNSADTDKALFGLSGCTSGVSPGATCTFSITFSPTSVGEKRATFTINSNAKNVAPSIQLSGVGVLPPPPTITPLELEVNVLGVTRTVKKSVLDATDEYGLALTASVKRDGLFGSVAFASSDSALGLEYTVEGHLATGREEDVFTVEVSNGYTSSELEIPVVLRGDPLVAYQWHLENTGQDAFSSTFPIAGNDMNISSAWKDGVSGAGVKVAVVDDGLEGMHEDLAENFDLEGSFNFVTQGNDPTPNKGGRYHSGGRL
jgi:hypothetical protein